MPIFSYVISESKKTKKGMLRASSYEGAKQTLMGKKALLLELKEIKTDALSKLKPSMVLELTKDIYHLLRSKLPLYDAMLSCEEKYAHSKTHLIVLFLTDQIEQGVSLSQALKKIGHSFDVVYISLIEAAESSGKLEETFKSLADMLQRRASIKAQLQKALMYPLCILSFASLMLFFLFWSLIPQLREFFTGKDLHPMTQFVVSVSDLLHAYAPVMLLGGGLTALLLGKWFFHRKQSQLRQKMLLSLPLVSAIVTENNWLKCTQTLAALLFSNVSLQKALSLVRQMVTIEKFSAALGTAQERLEQGKSLTEMFQSNVTIPPILLRMLATAEQTGETATMLKHCADIFEVSLDKKLHQLNVYLQPILLVAIGAIIAFVILAVLLPLSDMGSF